MLLSTFNPKSGTEAWCSGKFFPRDIFSQIWQYWQHRCRSTCVADSTYFAGHSCSGMSWKVRTLQQCTGCTLLQSILRADTNNRSTQTWVCLQSPKICLPALSKPGFVSTLETWVYLHSPNLGLSPLSKPGFVSTLQTWVCFHSPNLSLSPLSKPWFVSTLQTWVFLLSKPIFVSTPQTLVCLHSPNLGLSPLSKPGFVSTLQTWVYFRSPIYLYCFFF